MKHYIVIRDDELYMSYADNPKKAIWQIIEKFEFARDTFNQFRARSVGSLVNEHGNVMKFVVKEVEEEGWQNPLQFDIIIIEMIRLEKQLWRMVI